MPNNKDDNEDNHDNGQAKEVAVHKVGQGTDAKEEQGHACKHKGEKKGVARGRERGMGHAGKGR